MTCYDRVSCPDQIYTLIKLLILISAGCYYEGSQYRPGQRFTNPADQCYTCTCQRGTVTCYDRVPCPDLGACQSVATFDGECCPYCLDCGGRANGSMWNETPCQKCICLVSMHFIYIPVHNTQNTYRIDNYQLIDGAMTIVGTKNEKREESDI